MRVLVTGAAGFVGSHLVDRLLAEGREVSAVDDLSTGRLDRLADARRAGGVTFTRADVLGEGFGALVARARPEVVCHLAEPSPGAPAPVLARGCVDGAVAVLEAAVGAGARKVLLTASAAVYGVPTVQPVTERAGLAPVGPEGAAQVAAQAFLGAYRARHGLASTVLVLADAYGPRQDAGTGVVADLVDAHLAGRRAVVGTGAHDLVHVEDVAGAVARCLDETGDGRRLHVGSGVATSSRALHGLVSAATGAPDDPHVAPGGRAGVVLDGSALRRAAGWVPTTALPEGLAHTVEWWRSR